MPNKKTNNKDQESLQKKLEDLIRRKTDENSALKKLLDGLDNGDSMSKNENK